MQKARADRNGLPQPLLDALIEGRVLPLIGSGLSRNAVLPSGRRMPVWSELGDEMADEVTTVSPRADALEVISAYCAEHGRQALVARLRRALHEGYAKPGPVHRAFARLPFEIVVTTNFDGLLEDAYRAVARPSRILVREDQLASQVPRSAVSLVKAHGDYDNEPVLIATEDDYDTFLIQRPLLATFLANLLITRVALLIGYSLTDQNWRQLLAAVRSRLGRSQQTVYAIEVDADIATEERFRRRGVTLINLSSDGRAYGEVLLDAFAEMHAYIGRHALDNSIVRDEGALEELRAPTQEERRLCLFLLPERLLAYYREHVFPVLREEAGVQPITPYDVDAPGVSLYSTAIGLLDKAGAIVVDLTDGETGARFEVDLATTTRADRLAVVIEHSDVSRLPSSVQEGEPRTVIFKDSALDPELPSLLASWTIEMLGPPTPHMEHVRTGARPVDGFDAGWLVVRAYRDLEIALAERYGPAPVRFSAQLSNAQRTGILPARLVERLATGYRMRNEVLHRAYTPSINEAERALQDVAAAMARLDDRREPAWGDI